MKSQYLATFFFFLEKDPCKIPSFSLPLKVAVQFLRACRHIAIACEISLLYLQVCVRYQNAFPSRLRCHFLYFPYAPISTMQLTNNCVARNVGETTTKISDGVIFWLHEFSP